MLLTWNIVLLVWVLNIIQLPPFVIYNVEIVSLWYRNMHNTWQLALWALRWIIEAPTVLPPLGRHLVHTALCQQREPLCIVRDSDHFVIFLSRFALKIRPAFSMLLYVLWVWCNILSMKKKLLFYILVNRVAITVSNNTGCTAVQRWM